jgi:RNA polymerase sigma factor (sigma-70 family)
MGENESLAKRFEENRTRLKAIAYRMLGTLGEADDAVQEAWLRLSRSDTSKVENLGGWLTTVVARVSLDMLRSRSSRREEPLDQPGSEHAADPIENREGVEDPEYEALLTDSVGLALLVVLETLSPAERLALVLHDAFAVPFEEIVPIIERSPNAARKLASRARRRVRGTVALPAADLARQRKAVEAFLAAARGGDFDTLFSVLDPDVVLRADYGAAPAIAGRKVPGAMAVASEAVTFSGLADSNHAVRPVSINGAAGQLMFGGGETSSIMRFTVAGGKIVAIDLLAERLRRLVFPIPGDLRPAPRLHGVRHGPVVRHRGSWSVAQPRCQTSTPVPVARRIQSSLLPSPSAPGHRGANAGAFKW